jgi:prepilin-type N-terminal cleavage/methylation domain-containing protein
MNKANTKGFTMVEIMFVISIIGLLAALGIPSVVKAYSSAQTKAMDANVASVEKAKGVLTLPSGLNMAGAMGLDITDDFDDAAVSNLCAALRINDISELTVGKHTITIGDLAIKAYYN